MVGSLVKNVGSQRVLLHRSKRDRAFFALVSDKTRLCIDALLVRWGFADGRRWRKMGMEGA